MLVTDARVPAALAAIRSLGRAGFPVVAVGSRRTDPGLLSRHARTRVRLPDVQADPDRYIVRLAALVGSLPRPLVLPVTDATVTALDDHRHLFPDDVLAALPAAAPLAAVLDRETTLRVARRLGIPFPRTRLVATETDVVAASRELAFPAVVKPRRSRWFTPDGRMAGATAVFAATPIAAARALRSLGAGAGAALLQEFHAGEGRGVFLLMRGGEPVARFAHRRRLSLHPGGGASARAVSAPAEGDAYDASVALLRDIGWEGPAMVEWLRPASGGPDLLMEVNGRLWGSLALAVRAGVDFPALWIRSVLGEDARGPERQPPSTELRHLLGEAVHAARVLKGPPEGWPGHWPTRRGLSRLLLPSSAARVAWQMIRFDDPLPFVGELLGALPFRKGSG